MIYNKLNILLNKILANQFYLKFIFLINNNLRINCNFINFKL